MASCNTKDILAAAYAAGFAKLADRDLRMCVVVGACGSTVPACNAQPTLELVAADGYSKLSERNLSECEVYSACASPATPNAQDLILGAYANRLPSLSQRDLDASVEALTCKRNNPPCVTPTAPVLKGVNSDPVNGTILQVTWSQLANSGSLITGYTVFWGTTSNVYTNNSGLRPATPHQYVITGLTPSTTYFVVVVANTNIAGCQSANSNEKSNATSGGGACVNADTNTWVANVVSNGDPVPSGTVQAAVCTFANATSSLKARTPYVGVIAPGATIITLETPFFPGPINNPPPQWTQSGVGGDSVNGLTANSGGRFWRVNWTSNALSINNCGFSIYMPITGGVGAFLDYGGYDGTNGVYAGLNFTGGTVVFTIGLAALQASIAYPGPGFFSFNRTASNVLKVYWGNSTNPIAQIGATVVGDNSTGAFPGGTVLTQGYYLGAVNQAGVGPISNASNTYSYISQHDGFSLADVQQEFAAAEAMRVSFGGGFI